MTLYVYKPIFDLLGIRRRIWEGENQTEQDALRLIAKGIRSLLSYQHKLEENIKTLTRRYV